MKLVALDMLNFFDHECKIHPLTNTYSSDYLTMYKWCKINHVAYYFTAFIFNYDFNVTRKAEHDYRFGATPGVNSIWFYSILLNLGFR